MHLITEDSLKACFRDLAQDKAPGIDKVTMTEYEANLTENIRHLLARLKARTYRPQPVKRVYIPKPNGKQRPLGIPAVEDKVVQMACKKILEAIFEVDFLDVSYGFRPQRGCHDALDDLDRTIMREKVNYVVDLDIERFFDTVSHPKLMKFLKSRIKDGAFRGLIARLLEAGAVFAGEYQPTHEGTPQGSIVSPILANLYLHHVLDSWFEYGVKKTLKGYARLIRYADDFVVCFEYEWEAKNFINLLRERLGKVGLKIAEAKSRLIEFGRYRWAKARRLGQRLETFDFLGFTHYCDHNRAGGFKLGRRTARTRMNRALKGINEWLRRVRNRGRLEQWWPILAAKLRGHYNYYGIGGNLRSLQIIGYRTMWLAYRWINQRSQKRSYNVEQYLRWLKYHPLPEPRICHGYRVLTRMYS
jgi:group II intron reverse transcriptase/maturase